MFVVADEQNEHGVGWLHAVVQRPDGMLVDSLGLHDSEELLDGWLPWASGADEEGVWLHPADEELLQAKAPDEDTRRMADKLVRQFLKLSSDVNCPGSPGGSTVGEVGVASFVATAGGRAESGDRKSHDFGFC